MESGNPSICKLTFCTAVEHDPEAFFAVISCSCEGDVSFVGGCSDGNHLFWGAADSLQHLTYDSAVSKGMSKSRCVSELVSILA